MIIGVDGNEANIKNRVGVNQYAAELLTALEKLPAARKHNWIVYLVEQPLGHLPKERDGWRYEVLPGRGLWVLRRLALHLWLNRPRPDVFFTPSHYSPLLPPMPTVVSIMDLGYLHFPEQFKKHDFYQLKYWGQLSMRQAKKIIAISESTKRDIIRHYSWTEGRVEVTYLGYDKKRFTKSIKNEVWRIEHVKKKYGITGDYILYLGTLKPSKNIEGLVEAFANLNEPGLSLVIAGKRGWLYDAIFKKVRKLGLADKVIFTDFVSEDDKPYLYAGSEVFVNPSFWEGFGMSVLEAMACGTPVVVSNIASFPEVVGKTGVLVNSGSTEDIAKGISEALKKGNVLSKRALAQAARFDWSVTAEKTLTILERAAS